MTWNLNHLLNSDFAVLSLHGEGDRNRSKAFLSRNRSNGDATGMTISHLERLLQTARNAEFEYKAATMVGNAHLSELFAERCYRSQEFALELSEAICELGGEAKEEMPPSMSSRIHLMWMEICTGLAVHPQSALMQQCVLMELSILEAYEQVLASESLPGGIRRLLTIQYERISRGISQLKEVQLSYEGLVA